jgi:2',3'-cyclic-nucleotide 2'-phosphodiesterase (5'-nucleotidase family)
VWATAADKGGRVTRFARVILVYGTALIFSLAVVFAQQVSLTILHTNDTHGHLRPFSYPTVVAPGSELAALEERANIGGIARRAAIAKRLREELGRQGTAVWMIDAGDFSDGTAFSTEYHGEADVAAMNAAGYDFGTIGNHEFNYSFAQLKKLLGLFRYPVICANAVEKSTGALLSPAYVIRDIGSLKVGLFGLVTRSGSDYPAAREALTILDEIDTARRMVRELRPKTDIIIAISHSGDDVDAKIAKAVPEIDVIVGGHSHSRIAHGEFVWRSGELKTGDENSTVVVQAHQWGGELGRLDLLISRDGNGVWRVERQRAELLKITQDMPEDTEVAAVVDRYWKPIAAKYGEVLGQAAADFIERGDDLAPYNLMADSIRETFGSEIELENMGGVRAPLVKGAVTWADLVNMDPFDNTIVTFKISGRRLKQVLLEARPAVSGMRYRIEDGKLAEVTVGGKPLTESRIYSGSANSFFARNYLKGISVKNLGKPRLNILADYIRKKGTVRPIFDGRRIIVGP